MSVAMDAAAKTASQLFTFKENANTDDGSYHNPRVFFDVQIGMKKAGRIVIELFADIVPKTAEVRLPRSVRLACACLPHLPHPPVRAELPLPVHWGAGRRARLGQGAALQEHDLPPRDQGLHDAGRRLRQHERHRRRERLRRQVRGREPRHAAHGARHPLHGQRR
eukprot:scaffold38396_cov65-Phaeocystis_antarctica.AAC.7